VKVDATTYRTHKPFNEIHRVSCLRENLTSSSDGEGLETGQVVTLVPRQSFTRQLFFKWIKQNLRIKSFLGTSTNAVLTQIWVAMCYYLLLTYIKYQTKFAHSITELNRMIKEVLMERTNLIDILSLNAKTIKKAREPVPQLALF